MKEKLSLLTELIKLAKCDNESNEMYGGFFWGHAMHKTGPNELINIFKKYHN